MTKRKYIERRLLVISKRRQPTDEGLTRLVAAMVLHQLETGAACEAAAGSSVSPSVPDHRTDSA